MSNDKISYSIPAMKIHQREGDGHAIYVGCIKAADFSTRSGERFKIDSFSRIRNMGFSSGYQRSLSKKALDGIKKFVLDETPHPMFPTSIVVSSRTPLEFDEKSLGFGILHIYEPLYIIDGQHRFKAWKNIMDDLAVRNKWDDYEFPIVIMSGFERPDEMEQFYVINSRQKKIKTDLVHRLLLEFEKKPETRGLVSEKDKWIPRAVAIVQALNETEGVWKDLIGYDTDSDVERLTRVIQATSFDASLKPLFVGNKRLILKLEEPVDECLSLLKEYWEIISEIYPYGVNAKAKDYSLMKTVGVNVMHIFLVEVASSTGFGLVDKEQLLKKVREKLTRAVHNPNGGYREEFWLSRVSKSTKTMGKYAGAFSSSSGHKRLAMDMITTASM